VGVKTTFFNEQGVDLNFYLRFYEGEVSFTMRNVKSVKTRRPRGTIFIGGVVVEGMDVVGYAMEVKGANKAIPVGSILVGEGRSGVILLLNKIKVTKQNGVLGGVGSDGCVEQPHLILLLYDRVLTRVETDVDEQKREVSVRERDFDHQCMTRQFRVKRNHRAHVSVSDVARDSSGNAGGEGGDLRLGVVWVVGVKHFVFGESGVEGVEVAG
jgi:hypothetical protein